MNQKLYNRFIKHISNAKYIRAVEKPYQQAMKERNDFYKFIQNKYNISCFWAGGKFHVTYPNVEETNHFSNEVEAMVWLTSQLINQ